MSIIKKTLSGENDSGTTLPNSDVIFFHENSNLGSPYTLVNTELNYISGSDTIFSGSNTTVDISTNAVTLSVEHYHYSPNNDIGGSGNGYDLTATNVFSSAVNKGNTVTAQYTHYHRLGANFVFVKKAIKLYMYTGNINNVLPAGAIVLSDLENIDGCIKMGDNTDQFLFGNYNYSPSLGSNGIGLNNVNINLYHLSEIYFQAFHDHSTGAAYGSDVNYMNTSKISSTYLFNGHSHGSLTTSMHIDPNTIILRLFKVPTAMKIKEGMILGAKNSSAINGINGWAICDGNNGTPDIVNRCPVINNSKPINEVHNSSLTNFVTIDSATTETRSPSTIDHTDQHLNNSNYSNFASGSDTFYPYANGDAQSNNSVNNTHNHHTGGYSGKMGFGEIIFIKYKG